MFKVYDDNYNILGKSISIDDGKGLHIADCYIGELNPNYHGNSLCEALEFINEKYTIYVYTQKEVWTSALIGFGVALVSLTLMFISKMWDDKVLEKSSHQRTIVNYGDESSVATT